MSDLAQTLDSQALSRWYAGPLSKAQADHLVSEVRGRKHSQRPRVLLDIELLVGHFWQGRDIFSELAPRFQITTGQDERALLELVTGQLLISRKLNGALEYLDQGFRHATPFLSARDYLALMNRHRRLRSLELGEGGGAGLTLDELLQEAAVVDRIRGGEPHRMRYNPKDTLG